MCYRRQIDMLCVGRIGRATKGYRKPNENSGKPNRNSRQPNKNSGKPNKNSGNRMRKSASSERGRTP